MTTSEILLPDELDELRQGALLARVRLGLEANLSLPPSKLLAALDAYVSDYVSPPTEAADRSNAECDDPEEFIFECGCLWGEQLAQTLLWQWRRIHFGPREPEAIAVASADASLVVYPFQTIFLYCERVLPVRIARSLAVLSEPGRVPMLPPGGLENVMDHIE